MPETKRAPGLGAGDLYERVPEFPEKLDPGDLATLNHDVSTLLPRLRRETDRMEQVRGRLWERQHRLEAGFEGLAAKLQVILISQLLIREIAHDFPGGAGQERPAGPEGPAEGTAEDPAPGPAPGPAQNPAPDPNLNSEREAELAKFFSALQAAEELLPVAYQGVSEDFPALGALRAYVAEGAELFSALAGGERPPRLPTAEEISRRGKRGGRGPGSPQGESGPGALARVREWLAGPPEELSLFFNYALLNQISASVLSGVRGLFFADWDRRGLCADSIAAPLRQKIAELQARLEGAEDLALGAREARYGRDQMSLSRALEKRRVVQESLQELRASEEREKMGAPAAGEERGIEEALEECVRSVSALVDDFAARVEAYERMEAASAAEPGSGDPDSPSAPAIPGALGVADFPADPASPGAAGVPEAPGAPGEAPSFSSPCLLASVAGAAQTEGALKAIARRLEEFPCAILAAHLRTLPTDAQVAGRLGELLGSQEKVVAAVKEARRVFEELHAAREAGFDVDRLAEAVGAAVSCSFPEVAAGVAGAQVGAGAEPLGIPPAFEPALAGSVPQGLRMRVASSAQASSAQAASARAAQATLSRFFAESISREASEAARGAGRAGDIEPTPGNVDMAADAPVDAAADAAVDAADAPGSAAPAGADASPDADAPIVPGPIVSLSRRVLEQAASGALTSATEALSQLSEAIRELSRLAAYAQAETGSQVAAFLAKIDESAAADHMRGEALVLSVERDELAQLRESIDRRVDHLRAVFRAKIDDFQKKCTSLQDDAATYRSIESPAQFAGMYSGLLSVYRCSVCKNALVDTCLERCGHIFCRGCLSRIFDARSKRCPLCKVLFTEREMLSFPEMDLD